jgi:hypothetical protein
MPGSKKFAVCKNPKRSDDTATNRKLFFSSFLNVYLKTISSHIGARIDALAEGTLAV